MKSARVSANALLFVAVLAIGWGCTVTPTIPRSQTIAWDGNDHTAGFTGWTNGWGIITEAKRQEYNSLISIYGNRFTPRLSTDAGLLSKPPDWWITKKSLTDFLKMRRWHRAYSTPPTNGPVQPSPQP